MADAAAKKCYVLDLSDYPYDQQMPVHNKNGIPVIEEVDGLQHIKMQTVRTVVDFKRELVGSLLNSRLGLRDGEGPPPDFDYLELQILCQRIVEQKGTRIILDNGERQKILDRIQFLASRAFSAREQELVHRIQAMPERSMKLADDDTKKEAG